MKSAARRLLGWRRPDERGDIPGWVMVTVLTITLAIGLFAIFQEQLTNYLQSALDNLTS
jgi:hypothetical protein